ncbi:HNH endonuclease family protein [Nonomuraea sp. NPDC050328]|uniref:HNH endonuclease family protein n=1 Tax=Nonomuraea sp. NPDC050328 TaxID=3364361 RepID=UPI0037AF50A6
MSTRDTIAVIAGAVMILALIGKPATTSRAAAASPLTNTDGTRSGLAPLTTGTERRQGADVIRGLRTRPMGSKAGYDRLNYGANWADTAPGVPYAHNGCRTRDDLLARDGHDLTRDGCAVKRLRLEDPYTGRTITRPGQIQVDHVVPLSYAWRMGARSWPMSKRLDFAQDPLNLLPVDGAANEAKDGSGPASWLPPRARIRCAYAVRFAQVARKYRLPVTPADKSTMLAQCR